MSGEENQEVTELGRNMTDYVRDLYESGKKLWDKKWFDYVESELAKEPQPSWVYFRSSKYISCNSACSTI